MFRCEDNPWLCVGAIPLVVTSLLVFKSERLEGVSVPVTERSEGERVNVIHER